MLKEKSLVIRIIAIAVLFFGIILSIVFGQSLKDNAEFAWFAKATETAESATDSCLSWLALQQMQLRGIASAFYGPEIVTEDLFFNVLDTIEVSDSLPFNSIYYAIQKTTPSGDKYIVSLNSGDENILSVGSDLVQNEQIKAAISTAHNFPGEVILSSSFKDSYGSLMACFLIAVQKPVNSAVLAAMINVQELLDDLAALHIPKGLSLQEIQMASMGDSSPQPVIFFQSALPFASSPLNFQIRVDSGKAHLVYIWGVDSDFSGGPATEFGCLVQIAGSLFMFILFVAVWLLVNENVRVRQKVLERTNELSATSERLNALSEASFEAIVLSENGICIDLNSTAIKMFGYTKEEAIGSPDTMIFTPEQLEKVREKVQTEAETSYEVVAMKKNGSILPVLLRGRTIDYLGSRVRMTAMSDITDRKNAEAEKEKLTEQLHQARKMESIGLMAGGVAHDLNNILSAIVGYPELLLRTLPEDSKLRKPIKAIHDSGQRAATVVADLLTVARGVATTREVHDINLLVQEYFNSPECDRTRSLHTKIDFQTQLAALPLRIKCSTVHVKKCLMNLVINAAEAIIDPGTVVVSTYNQFIDELTAKKLKLREGKYVVLNVRDNGPGIANSDLEHIFEPFFTQKKMGRSGTGLGLTVVWNTMDDHDGKVFVESSNEGTSFKLYFPASNDQNLVVADERSQSLVGNNEHILVVDDELQLRDLASQILQSFGYRVDSVSSGELAVNFVKKNPVDLVVLDMLMDPGMNGYQTYKEIVKLYPDQKAIIASGFSESDDVKATIELGARKFVKKPYLMDQLGQAVKDVMRS